MLSGPIPIRKKDCNPKEGLVDINEVNKVIEANKKSTIETITSFLNYKACKWLRENINKYQLIFTETIPGFIDDFKKAMEKLKICRILNKFYGPN